jgi:hypothetical protein
MIPQSRRTAFKPQWLMEVLCFPGARRCGCGTFRSFGWSCGGKVRQHSQSEDQRTGAQSKTSQRHRMAETKCPCIPVSQHLTGVHGCGGYGRGAASWLGRRHPPFSTCLDINQTTTAGTRGKSSDSRQKALTTRRNPLPTALASFYCWIWIDSSYFDPTSLSFLTTSFFCSIY